MTTNSIQHGKSKGGLETMAARCEALTDYTPGQIACLACTLEMAAPKPGNVHRGADFEDLTLTDFLAAATALGHVIDRYMDARLGEMVLAAAVHSERLTRSNANLGIVLLLCPLAKAAGQSSAGIRPSSVVDVLGKLTTADTREYYQAIQQARPGGMGTVESMDVRDSAPESLLRAMQLASAHDAIAKQYVNGFGDVFDWIVPVLLEARSQAKTLSEALVLAHLRVMARLPDSLIARKCGRETAEQSAAMAGRAVELWESGGDSKRESFWEAVSDLDFWLRSDGNRRNPGTTADLIVAALFVALVNRKLTPPF